MKTRQSLKMKVGASLACGAFVLLSATPIAGASAAKHPVSAKEVDPALCAAAKSTVATVAELEAALVAAKAAPKKFIFGVALPDSRIISLEIQLINIKKTVDADLLKACGI